MARLSVLVLLAGAALFAGRAHAEDAAEDAKPKAPPVSKARSAYDAARAKLPAPSEDKALMFEGHVIQDDVAVGTFSITAAPVKHNDQAAWFVEFRVQRKGEPIVSDAAHVSATFDTLDGSLSTTTKDGEQLKFWVTESDGIRISEVTEDETVEPQSALVVHTGSYLGCLAQLLHFTWLSKHAAGEYETEWFDASHAQVTKVAWKAGISGTWGGVPAKMLEAQRADGIEVRAAFDPKSHALLGFVVNSNGVEFDFRAGPSELDAFYRDPPKTAHQAAAQSAMAFATADFDILNRVAHWPSILEMAKQVFPDEELDEDLVRAYVKSRLKPTLSKQARAGFAAKLQARVGKLKVEENEDGTVTVPFGSRKDSLKLTLRKLGEQWYLVSVPDGVLR